MPHKPISHLLAYTPNLADRQILDSRNSAAIPCLYSPHTTCQCRKSLHRFCAAPWRPRALSAPPLASPPCSRSPGPCCAWRAPGAACPRHARPAPVCTPYLFRPRLPANGVRPRTARACRACPGVRPGAAANGGIGLERPGHRLAGCGGAAAHGGPGGRGGHGGRGGAADPGVRPALGLGWTCSRRGGLPCSRGVGLAVLRGWRAGRGMLAALPRCYHTGMALPAPRMGLGAGVAFIEP